jgi:tetratricopeptide (TPR) repeat protein
MRSYIATVGALAAFLIAGPFCGEQTSLDQAADLLSRGLIGEAVAILRHIIVADASDADAHLLLGTALALQEKRSESIEEMAEALRLRPQSASAHNQYGMVLSRFVELKAARREFEKALELDPLLAEAHVNLSLLLAQSGELMPAGEHLDRAIELQGERRPAAYAHYLRAKIWGAQDQIDRSIVELMKAVQLRPDYAEAWSDLGGMRRLALDRQGAVEALEKAVALNPHDAIAQYRLGQQYLQDGEAADAIEHLKSALLGDPDDVAALYNLERALRKTGRLDEATHIGRQITELRKRTDRASTVALSASRLNNEGIELERSGETWAALAKYRAALDLDPTGFGFELNYALALCRVGRWENGVIELREVLRLDPDNGVAAKALYIANEHVTKSQTADTVKVPPKSNPKN